MGSKMFTAIIFIFLKFMLICGHLTIDSFDWKLFLKIIHNARQSNIQIVSSTAFLSFSWYSSYNIISVERIIKHSNDHPNVNNSDVK